VTPHVRLAFVVSSLACGGAERVVQLLSGGLAERGHEVTVITTTEREDFFHLPPGVDRIRIGLVRYVEDPYPRLADPPAVVPLRAIRGVVRLRRTLSSLRPDLVIAFTDRIAVLTLLAARGLGIPVVASERSDPALKPLGPAWRLLRRVLYPSAAALVCLSHGVASRFTWLPADRCLAIHNPVPPPPPDDGSPPPLGLASGGYVLGMGRLAHEKGFDLLLRAYARSLDRVDPGPLVIAGEGEERPRLETLAAELGIASRLVLPGAVRDPWPLLRHAAFLVLSSRFEGFGNVLVEAMACGRPVVAFACPSGPDEIVEHGRSGLLVPPGDTAALARAMARLAADTGLRRRMGEAARERSRAFSLERILDLWEDLVIGTFASSPGIPGRERHR